MKPDRYLTLKSQNHSKWIKDLKIGPEAKNLEENKPWVVSSLIWILAMTPKGKATEETNRNVSNQKLQHSKGNHHFTEWKKMGFASHICSKGLISKTYKALI